MKQIIYSVIVAHQAEVYENYLFRDKGKAVAKMEEVKDSWVHDDVTIHKYRDDMGYWYENDGDMSDGLWEYGCVELLECVLDAD